MRLRQFNFLSSAFLQGITVSFFLVLFFVLTPRFVFAADIEAVTDSTDGSSAFTVKNSSNVEQAHIDSIGNLVAKGCVRVDSGLVECSESEGLIVDGNVGFGTVNPLSKLQVSGGLARFGLGGTLNNVSGTGEVYIQSNLEVDGVIYGDASGLFNLPAGLGGWTDGGTNVFTSSTTDTVGIGTTTPSTTLEIVKQAANPLLMLSSVPAGDGDYIIVASSGNVGIGTTTPGSGLSVMNGNVGIGTVSATARLQVVGSVSATAFVGDGSGLTGLTSAGGFTDGGANVYTTTTTDSVGIGTTSPASKLNVSGSAAIGSGAAYLGLPAPADGLIVQGALGVGTFAPIGNLDVRGDEARIWTGAGTNTNALAAGELYVEGDLEVDGTIYGDGSGITSLPSTLPAGGWTDGGSNVYTSTTTDNVGIGTTTPNAATLEIVKNAAQPLLRVSSAAATAGDYLIVTSIGNVGIGTTVPFKKFTVVSTTTANGIESLATAALGASSGGGIAARTGITPTGANQRLGGFFFGSNNGVDEYSTAGIFGYSTEAYSATNRGSYFTFETVPTGASGRTVKMRIENDGAIGIGTSMAVRGTAIMNGNVGIGTWSPIGSLEVKGGSATRIWTGAGTDTNAIAAGELYVEGDLEVDGTIYGDGSGITALPAGLAAGGWTDGGTVVRLTTDTDSVGIGTSAPVGALVVMSGNVGIGTWSPTSALQVVGNVAVSDDPYAVGWDGSAAVPTKNAVYDKIETVIAASASGWTDGGQNVYTTATTDAVGIGTTTPNATFEIVGQASAVPMMISSTPAGLGNTFIVTSAGNIGINTVSPGQRLDIRGNLRMRATDALYFGDDNQSFFVATAASGGGLDLYTATVKRFGVAVNGLTTFSANVGLGTVAPGAKLAIIRSGSTPNLMISSVASSGGDYFIVASAGNVGLGTTAPVAGLAVMNGNVGIGTWSPIGSLEVRGGTATRIWTGAGTDTNATTAGELYVEGDLEVDGTIYGDGSGITALPTTLPAGGWTDNGTSIYTTTLADNVGIGTTSTLAKLTVGVAAGENFEFTPGSVGLNGGIIEYINRVAGATRPDMNYYISAAGSHKFLTSGIERMRIGADGNVGIGTAISSGGLAVMSGNVGIGTWKPANSLQINIPQDGFGIRIMNPAYTSTPQYGEIVFSGSGPNTMTLQTNLNSAGNAIDIAPGGSSAIRAVYSGTAGLSNVGIGTTTPVGGLVVMNGNAGIGTWSPTAKLQVIGTVDATAFVGDGSGLTNISAGGWTDGGTNVYTAATTDNVGIGTTTPNAATLEIVKNAAQPALKISSTFTGSGDFFIVDSSGNIGIGTTMTSSAALALMNGNVGIGTIRPGSKFEIQDTLSTTSSVAINRVYNSGVLRQQTMSTGIGEWYLNSTAAEVGKIAVSTPGGEPGLIFFTGASYNANRFDIVNSASASTFYLGFNADNAGRVLTFRSGGNVGITDDSPDALFEISKSAGSAPYFMLSTDDNNDGNALLIDSSGNVGLGTIAPVGALTVMNGNVGIGTWSPVGSLEVRGGSATRIWTGAGTDTNALGAGELYVEGDLEVDGTIYGDGSGITSLPSTLAAGGWTDGGTVVYLSATTDNVGIGTTTPDATLEIAERGVTPLMISDGIAGNGELLMVTSAGNVGLGTTTPGGALSILSGNVGIGTVSPTARLQVIGTVNATAFVGDGSGLTSISGAITGLNTGFIPKASSASTINDSALFQLGTGIGIGTITPVGGLTVMTGSVGIGTWSPVGALEVKGGDGAVRIWTGSGTDTNALSTGELYVEGDLEVDGTIYGNGAGITGAVQNGGGWFDGGPDVYLASTTDNVGVGTTTPHATLEVISRGVTSLMISNTTTGDGDYLIVTSLGNVGLGTTTPVGALTVMSGNVGVGTWSPTAGLEVKGSTVKVWTGAGTNTNAVSAGEFYVEGDLEVDGTIYGDGSGITALPAGLAAGGWTDGGTIVYLTSTTDNVGIGTTTPDATLEIAERGVTPLMISDGITGNGELMIVTSTGNVGLGTTTPIGALTVMNGNVGIGTWSPSTLLAIRAADIASRQEGLRLIDSGLGSTEGLFIRWDTGDRFNQARIGLDTSDDVSGGDLAFYTNSTGASATLAEQLRITALGNVGIGTSDPGSKLSVLGNVGIGSRPYAVIGPNTNNGLVVEGNVGIGTWSAAEKLIVASGNVGIGTLNPVGGLVVMSGNVGIGTWSPTSQLQVVGNVSVTDDPYAAGWDGSTAVPTKNAVYDKIEAVAAATSSGWTDGGTNIYTTATTDNVGIGTTTPNTATLEIVKNAAQAPLKISSTATGAGDFLNVSSAGLVGIGTSRNSASTGLAVMNGNVGIGTWSASAGLVVASGGIQVGTNEPSAYALTFASGGDIGLERNSKLQFYGYSGGFLNRAYITSNSANDLIFGGVNGEVMRLISSGALGIGTSTPVAGLAVMTGNVGIGTWSPSSGLEVKGSNASIISTGGTNSNATAAGELYVQGDLEVDGTIYGDGSGITGAVTSGGGWTDGGTNVYTSTTTDNVGIGTTTPTANFKLDVRGTSYLSGAVGIGTTLASSTTGLSVMNGNVGIGTWNPRAQLEITDSISNSLLVASSSFSTYPTLSLSGRPGAAGQLYGQISFQDQNSGGLFANIKSYRASSTTNATDIAFETYGDGFGTLTEKMRIVGSGNIGIGTTIPVGALTIMNGNVGIGTWSVDGVSGALIVASGAGNVGIGTIRPGAALDVNGIIRSISGGVTFPDGTTQTTAASGVSGWTDGGTNIYTTATTDNVGIGTTTPNAATLEIVKNAAQPPLKISSTATGAGDFLNVSSSGLVGIGTSLNSASTGLAVMNGNVGIGTWSPSNLFQVGTSAFSVTSAGIVATGSNLYPGNNIYLTGPQFPHIDNQNTTANGALIITGGGAVSSGLILQSTSAVGTTDYINLLVGNDGATEAMRAVTDGNIGIGTAKPYARLAIATTASAANYNNVGANDVYIQNDLEVDGIIYGDGSGLTNISAGGWTDGGTNVYTSNTSDTVGIGTTTAPAKLTVGVGAGENFEFTPGHVGLNGGVLEYINRGSGATRPDMNYYISAAGAHKFSTSGIERLRIDGGGNVGVGTSAPRGGLSVMNGNVGIGTTNPGGTLDIAAGQLLLPDGAQAAPSIAMRSNPDTGIYFSGSSILMVLDGGSLSPRFALTSSDVTLPNIVFNGGSNQSITNISNADLSFGTNSSEKARILASGNFGIGTSAPTSLFEIVGGDGRIGIGTFTNSSTSADLYVQGNLEVDGTLYGDASGLTNLPGGSSGWTDGGANVYTSITTDNVGIGTTTPTSTLEVVKTAAGTAPFMVSSTATSDGDLLVISSSGNIGIGTTLTTTGALTIMTGNVGIGTWSPRSAMDINGSVMLPTTGYVRFGGSTSSFPAISYLSATSVASVLADGSAFASFGAGTLAAILDVSVGSNGVFGFLSTPTNRLQSGSVDVGFARLSVGKVAVGSGAQGDSSGTLIARNIGIGTFNPLNSLVINGGVGIGTLSDSSFIDTLAPSGGLIVENNVGIGTTRPVGALVVMNGNVGIGTWSPTQRLQVVGTVAATAFTGDGSGLTGLTAGGWTDGGTNIYTSITTDNVGIGTTTPNAATLEVVKNAAQAPLKISSTATGAGDFLNVNSAGLVGIGTTLNSAATGLAVMNGGVGIGTWNARDTVDIKGGLTARTGGTDVNEAVVLGTPGGDAGIVLTASNSVRADIARSTTDLRLVVSTSSSAPNATDGITILNGGNVGIGTTIPVSGLAVMNGNVGIGTWSPTSALQVKGGDILLDNNQVLGMGDLGNSIEGNSSSDYVRLRTNFTEALRIDSTQNIGIGTSTPVGGLVIMNGNAGVGTWSPTAKLEVVGDMKMTGSGNSYFNGSVGIGNSSPTQALDVTGTAKMTGFQLTTGAVNGYVLTSDGAGTGTWQTASGLSGGWTDGGTNVYTSTTTDNVGIGTTTPTSTLEVVKTAAGTAPFMVSSTATSDGNYLMVGSSGSIGIGTTLSSAIAGLSVMNGNVGIGTWNPLYPLDVFGVNAGFGLRVESGIYSGSGVYAGSFVDADNGVYYMDPAGAFTGYSATLARNVGIGTLNPVGALTVMNGNVGLGTWSPTAGLEVKGSAVKVWAGSGTNTNAVSAGELYVEGDLEVDGTIYGDGSGITALPTTLAAGGWVDGGSNVYQATTTDNVGIGTTTPSTTLEIVKQSTNAPLMVSSVAAGDGDFLMVTSSGNVGINKVAPSQKLEVDGGMSIDSGAILHNSSTGITSINSLQLGAMNFETNAGAVSWVDMPVTGAAAIGTAQSYTAQIDGNAVLTVYAESNGAGGIQKAGVGIGTTMPSGGLSVMNGNVGIGTWNLSGNSGALIVAAGAGNVGIGTIRPGTKLDVNGIVRSISGGFTFPDGTTQTTAAGAVPGWTDGGTNVYTSTTTDNVGIGTTTPTSTLEVVKTAAATAPLMVSSTGSSDGDVLVVSSSGNVGIGTTFTTTAGLSVMNGNVGIGTWSPNSLFEVNGAMGTVTISKSGAYTATINDSVIIVDASGGAVTITLPAAATVKGRVYHVKKTDASLNALTIDGNASETIDGVLTVNTTTQFQSYTLVCDGANWWMI